MTPSLLARRDKHLDEFLDYMVDGLGRPERRHGIVLYLTGLLLSGERKTALAMGRRLAECDDDVQAVRQQLQRCVSTSRWADDEVRRRLALRFEKTLKPEAYILDDTGFPKKGEYSVGVQRQYSGTLGRVDNCQVAPSLHVATDDGSGCIGMRLYLPKDWCEDSPRRREAGVPDDVEFKTKWEIGIDLLDDALGWGLPQRLMIADAGYGDSTEFRDALDERGCQYVVGIAGNHMVWPVGSNPRKPKHRAAPGHPRSRYRDERRKPKSISQIGERLTYRKFTVPDGCGGKKAGRYAIERVQLAERHTKGRPPSEKLWLICEWRSANREFRYHVSNLPASTTKSELVRLTKLRWRVERDYQEMKGEIGLDHFEGRTWRGFHHHATLCAVAHGFLAIQRQLFPPAQKHDNASNGEAANPTIAARAHRRLSVVSTAI
jgi:SRSO17 transposase